MDSFFSKGFKASKCKTMLKLTIPRIKLLRNRREIQIKQMRRDIAKLLETGQEAIARIRVEHIIREEKMMAAQEIIELFCELIAVRLPIIESQKECPLDLKEAISSVCFAAPRCADLPELQQVQLLFLGKYGKDFVAAATELRPECGVNRQLIELLSIRAPSGDVKLKILKEIAEEHQLDWDSSGSESELLKHHDDLLNGPAQFVSSSKDELLEPISDEVSVSETGFDSLGFPDVPKQSIRATEMLPFPASALSDDDFESPEKSKVDDELPEVITVKKSEEIQFVPFILPPSQSSENPRKIETLLPEISDDNQAPVKIETLLPEMSEDNQYSNRVPVKIETLLPEIPDDKQYSNGAPIKIETLLPETDYKLYSNGAPVKIETLTPEISEEKQYVSLNPVTSSRPKREVAVDLQDLLAAAEAAAESAEQAATAARSAASLARIRISQLSQGKNESEPSTENPFHAADKDTYELVNKLDRETPLPEFNDVLKPPSPRIPSYEDADMVFKSSMSSNSNSNSNHHVRDNDGNDAHHLFERLPSMDDDPYSYPSLFTRIESNIRSQPGSFTEDHTSKS